MEEFEAKVEMRLKNKEHFLFDKCCSIMFGFEV